MEQTTSIQEMAEQSKAAGPDAQIRDNATSKSANNNENTPGQPPGQQADTGNNTSPGKEASPVPIDSKNIKSEDDKSVKLEDLGKRYEAAELWNQIYKHTKSIEIDEDKDFYWPEPRKHTEEVVQQLLSKRIMFIRSLSEDWLYAAVQRLASVLQSSSRLENLVLRITKSNLSFKNAEKDQLEFGFWNNQRRLPWPVVIFVSSNRQDIVQNFLSLSKETVVNQIYDDLKKTNLFIVCEVEDNVANRNLFDRFKKRIHGVFAIWDVPAIKLHIMKHLGREGKEFLEKFEETDLFKKQDPRSIYEGLIKIDLEKEKEVTNALCEELLKAGSDIESKKDRLAEIISGDDFISHVVIFCGAFFDGLYYSDFYKLVSKLLLDERQHHDSQVRVAESSPASVILPPLLAEVWQKNDDRILNACFLETRKEGGNIRVGFVIPQLAEVMADFIGARHYPLFHRMYRNFMKTELLTNIDLNEKLELYVIRFFSVAAKMDVTTHNARWLKNEVHGLWHSYEYNQITGKSYDEIIDYLQRENKLASIVFHRIPLIIGGLLVNSNDQFKDIIRDFFRLLLSEANARKIAIIIASYIYREYRLTAVFPTEDLMSYFQGTLEDGDWAESFFAYDALTENMGYKELQEHTKKWIDNPEIADTSYTKQFALFYQLHFILITVYRHFRQFQAEGTYELWDTDKKDFFPEFFRTLVKDILDERGFKSVETILNNEHGSQRFVNFVK